MAIEATVVADSVSPAGKRLTTFKLRYPKFIHGEMMTHRVISRNASSSRAILVAKMIAEVRDDATRAAPVFLGAEQKGMQAAVELDDVAPNFHKTMAQECWKRAALAATRFAEDLVAEGAHKQVVNRILEPFSHINVVATATEWDNFFGLRLDAGAQPEMRALAVAMWEARRASTPKELPIGAWHLPFVDGDEIIAHASNGLGMTLDAARFREAIKVSVARCARVSYESFETGKRSAVEEDLRLYERLVGSQPLHASPAEHQATPDALNQWYVGQSFKDGATCPECGSEESRWDNPEEHGNFVGWRQYRKMLPGEAVAPLPEDFL